MKSPEKIEKLIRNSEINSNPDVNQTVLENLIKQFDVTDEQKAPFTRLIERRILMTNPITKIAAVAVIIIAVTLGLFVFVGTGDTSGVVWAEVAEQVKTSRGFVCRSNVTMTNTVEGKTTKMDMRMYGSLQYGIRVDQYEDGKVVMSHYGNRADNTITSIIHSKKTYTREPLLEEDIANLEQMSPKKLVEQYLATDYKELGSDTLDGLEVEGIEVTDPSVIKATFPVDSITSRLWVSKETGFPVRMEAEITGSNGALKMQAVMNEFQWNMDLNASDFTPDIPSDYTLMEMAQP